jgi:hypothetical protein
VNRRSRVRFAVDPRSWGLPIAFRHDLPCDWWVITMFCFHVGFPAEGVEWGRVPRRIGTGIVDGLHRLWIF